MKPIATTDLSPNAVDFIDDEYLTSLITSTKEDPGQVRELIAKALNKEPLSVEETAALLAVESPDLQEEIFAAARDLKDRVYGNRIVLFAPLYIGNKCINNCLYCGFKVTNAEVIRRTLDHDEIRQQVLALVRQGHKRLILVFGEHPGYDADFIADAVRTVYETKEDHGEIRRVNINAAPLSVDGYKKVKDAGIGTYQIFQETYHHETYQRVHPGQDRKGHYLWRLDGLNRAMEAGLDDVGIGALFGLYDWRFEVLGLVRHALFLQERYNVGPHTISFPRMQPASGVTMEQMQLTDDNAFERLVAILRLAVPYTGLICTARESAEMRRTVTSFGVSQIDAGSRIELGGYTESGDAQVMEREQFSLGDIRPLDTVMRQLIEDGYLPSFCTSCYRLGRTGEHFMEFAIPGFIKRYCTPNALLTLEEYLVDYASPETRSAGEALIEKELHQLGDEAAGPVRERLARIKDADERDLTF